jgi:MinD-like ATPase involved in chromosome partitioning or flagellar assembly
VKTITFYSYKGGTGRSLTVANAALYLQRLYFRVTVIDFDLEAPGMHYKFAADPEAGRIRIPRGLIDYIYDYVSNGTIPESLSDFTINLKVGSPQSLNLIGAGDAPDPNYWQKLSRINWHELFYSAGSHGVELFFDLKNKIERELKPDFLLIDSRTGITETGGIATSLLADRIICLVSASRENLEGARSVLQSVNRTRRGYQTDPAEITIALSRVPEMNEIGSESEVVQRVLKILNEECEFPGDSLHVREDDAVTLHSEKSLEIREVLRIGSGMSPEESILLRDYLRLFASIVPQDLVGSKIRVMIEKARAKMWDNPNEAVKEVEELAESFGHPDIYRELLRFYEVRNITGISALKRAQRLWEISPYCSNEQLVWNTLIANFPPKEPRWLRDDALFAPRRDFVEAVWRDAGKRDPKFGLQLIEHYSNEDSDDHSRTNSMFSEMIDCGVTTPEVVSRYLQFLTRIGSMEQARSLIERFRIDYSQEANFIREWARYAKRYRDREYAKIITQAPYIDVIQKEDAVTLTSLLIMSGKKPEARELAERILNPRRLRELVRGPHEAEEIFREFTSIGLEKEISQALGDVVPAGEVARLRRLHGLEPSDDLRI